MLPPLSLAASGPPPKRMARKSFCWLIFAASLILGSGCSQRQLVSDFGHFENRDSEPQAAGIVVAVPPAFAEPVAVETIRSNPSRISVLDFGKIETIPASRNEGVVIGAPHGTFDVHTAGIVRTICSRTRLAGIIATGFTPTESGDGRRINVNRPTERHVAASNREFETERARVIYERFRSAVLSAAGGRLDLYIDLHQNGGQRIEVATVGVSTEEARRIKKVFLALRDQTVAGRPEIAALDLAIEPIDELEVGAWAAKTNGILTVASRSLHFELPASVLASPRHRRVYTALLAELIHEIAVAR